MHTTVHYPKALMRQCSGLSVVEVLVVIAIFATLLGVAAPNIRPIMRQWQVKTTTDAFMASLRLARVEAIKRSRVVRIIALAVDGTGENGCRIARVDVTDFSCGWRVFVDLNDDGEFAATEPTIQIVSKRTGEVSLQTTGGQRLNARFNNLGGTAMARMNFFPDNGADGAAQARAVCIAAGGRVVSIAWRQAPGCT